MIRLENVLKISLQEDVLKTSSEDEDERRLLKTKTKDFFKTFSRRLHQEECLVVYFFV